MQHRNRIVLLLLFILIGCSNPLVKPQLKIPSVEEIVTSDVAFAMSLHYAAAKVISGTLQKIDLDEITTKQISALDNVRYLYIAKAEILIAEGNFALAEDYLTGANKVLYDITVLLKNAKQTIYQNS